MRLYRYLRHGINGHSKKNAKAKEKPYKLTDGDGPYLLVKPNGGKYWRFKYLYVSKEKLLAFGTYPEISLKDAREKRLNARKLLAKGGDSSSKRKEKNVVKRII